MKRMRNSQTLKFTIQFLTPTIANKILEDGAVIKIVGEKSISQAQAKSQANLHLKLCFDYQRTIINSDNTAI